MKNSLLALIMAAFTVSMQAQVEIDVDSTGLPGDQFSLEGALALFQKADSPEAFEKSLNEQNNQVNNLDLNGDDETDYVRVVSKKEGDTHIFILQIPVNENESQDIAVIELEKTGKDEATLQIIGDEQLYGEEVIIEPSEAGVDNGADNQKGGPGPVYANRSQIIINVWGWPCVRYVYGPAYRPWISPWGWRRYPGWWRPWRPLGWTIWRPIRVHHHHAAPIRIVHNHRLNRAHSMYKPIRVHSTTVKTRHAGAHATYKSRTTRTTITGPKGRKVTTTKTSVKRSRRG